ncbi:MAG TPA: phospholipid carrier-dependent glycosyltransferase, partial [Thermoanaerobaculia bacterium]
MLRPARATIATVVSAAVLFGGAFLPQTWRWWQVVVAAALRTALGLTGRRLARWLVPEVGVLSRATAAAVFASLAAILPATVLGHFGVLRAAPFFVVEAALVLLALLVPQPPLSEAAAGPEQSAAEPDLEPDVGPRPFWRDLAPALLATALFVLLFVGVRDFLRIVREPDGSYGPDGISYHMSMVATWHRTGDLRTMKFAMGDASPAFYPLASELASWTLLAPFGDSDVLARRSQVPFTLFASLAIAALARRLGLSRRHQLLAVLLYAANERVFPWLGLSASNDPAATFFLLAALDGSLALSRRPRAGTAVYAGVAYGLLVGTKYLGILYAGAQLAVLALAWLVTRGTEDGEDAPPWRTQAALVALGVGVALVAGGYP